MCYVRTQDHRKLMFNLPFILFALVVLSIEGFFNPLGILDFPKLRALFCGLSFIAFVYAIFFSSNKISSSDYPRRLYNTILASIGFSIFMASAFHEQSITQSITPILPTFLAYLFFWTMMKLAVPKNQVIKFCLAICLVSIPVYFANAVTFPNLMFGILSEYKEGEDFSRGILRIPLEFLNIFCMMVFYSINQFILKRNRWFWLVIGILFAFMIIMSVWRQYIFIVFSLSFIFIFLHSSWLKRIILVVVVAGSIGAVTQIPMVKAMIELSEDQIDANEDEDDIRVYDYKYFGHEAQTNEITRVFGNGVPAMGNSPWGKQVKSEWDQLGTFAVDVAWVGFYWFFGAIGVICLLCLFVKTIAVKKRSEEKYLTYTFILYMLVNIANGLILQYDGIVSFCIALYLLYGADGKQQQQRLAPVERPQSRRRKITLLDYHNSGVKTNN